MDFLYESDFDSLWMPELEKVGFEFDIQMEELSFMETVLEKTRHLDLQKADLKYFREDASIEDLGSLYLESAKASNGKKKNLLLRMVDTIIGFISKVITAITGIFKKKTDNSSDGKESAKRPKKILNPYAVPGMTEAIAEEKKETAKMEKIVTGIKIGTYAAAAFAGIKGLSHLNNSRKEKKVDRAIAAAEKKINDAEPGIQKALGEELDAIEKKIKENKDKISSLKSSIEDTLNKNTKIHQNLRNSPNKDEYIKQFNARTTNRARKEVETLRDENSSLGLQRIRTTDLKNIPTGEKVLNEVTSLLNGNEKLMKIARKKLGEIDLEDPQASEKMGILQRVMKRVSHSSKSAQKIAAATTVA